MFKIIVLAGCAALLLHASQAQAGRSVQGTAINGRSIQGTAVNGRSIQGVAVNGVRTHEADATARLRVIGIELPQTPR